MTKALVERVSVEKDGQWITDSEFPQLLLRLTPTAKTFVARWQSRGSGKRQQVSIALVGTISCDEARDRARKLVAADAAPLAVTTLSGVYDVWEDTYSSKSSLEHSKAFAQAWKMYLEPEFGRLKLPSIKPAAIQKFYNTSRETHAAATVNRWLAYLSKLFTLAQQNGWLIGNPIQGIEKDTPTRRVSTFARDDAKALAENLVACEKRYPIGVALIRFLALYPCRGIEARTMRWADVDLENGYWTIRAADYKTDKDKVFPLTPVIVQFLKSLPRWSDSYVFPSPTDPQNPMRKEYQRDVWQKVRPNALGAHTLRKTTATGMLNGGAPLEVISKLLGHSSTAVTQLAYAHLDPLVGRAHLARYTATLEEDEKIDADDLKVLQGAASMSIAKAAAKQEAEEVAAHPTWKRTDAPPGLG